MIEKRIPGFNWGHSVSDRVERRLSWLQIPKCASTSVGAALHTLPFMAGGHFKKHPQTLTIAICRDPLERLVSGIYQTAHMKRMDPYVVAEQFIGWLTDPHEGGFIFDGHTAPMYEFLTPVNPVDVWIPIHRVNEMIPDVVDDLYGVDLKIEQKNHQPKEGRYDVTLRLAEFKQVAQYLDLDFYIWEKVR